MNRTDMHSERTPAVLGLTARSADDADARAARPHASDASESVAMGRRLISLYLSSYFRLYISLSALLFTTSTMQCRTDRGST